jgi:hypothetical protein
MEFKSCGSDPKNSYPWGAYFEPELGVRFLLTDGGILFGLPFEPDGARISSF